MRYVILLVTTLMFIVAGCSSPQPSPTTTTMGQLSATGQTVFASYCAKCHGANGQGITAPSIIGANANLQKYNTAKGLLDFIDTSMPFDAPGSLSQQQYQQVLGYLLVQNSFVSPGMAFDPNHLTAIQLTK